MKTKIVRNVNANRGVRAKYRKRMLTLIDDMSASYVYWLSAQYNKTPPYMALLAQDATPSDTISKLLADLGQRWIDNFDANAPKIADAYVNAMGKTTDASFMAALRDAGFTVKFTLTPTVRDVLDASYAENVALIKSIPVQYHTQVEGIVMRSYTAGRDLETMVKELKALYPKAAHRAELIARDQSNKLNAVVTRARALENGLTTGLWLHSHAGKTPRPSHVAADKKPFDIAKGMLIDGEYIQPGEKINCRCGVRMLLPI